MDDPNVLIREIDRFLTSRDDSEYFHGRLYRPFLNCMV